MKLLRLLLWLVIGLVVLAAGAVFVLPHFIDAESQKGTIVARLEGALHRKVKLGAIALSVFPPKLTVGDVEIGEDSAFGTAPFVTAKSLEVHVNMMPLLSRQLEVTSLQMDEPTIRLIKNKGGEWNFSTLGKEEGKAGKGAASAPPSAAAAPLAVDELLIKNGTVYISDLKQPKQNAKYDQINLTLNGFAPAKAFLYKAAMHLPGSGQSLLEAEGKAGPLAQDDPMATPAEGKVKLTEIDLHKMVPDQPGLMGSLSTDSNFTTDGKDATANGDFTVAHLRLSPQGSPAQAPVTGKYNVKYALKNETLDVKELVVHIAGAAAQIGGHLSLLKPAASEVSLKTTGAPLTDVAKLMPALGIKLPAGSSIAGGTLTGSTTLHGPFEHLNGKTTVDVQNARLAGYSFTQQLSLVAKLAGIPVTPDTQITKLASNLSFVNGNISTNDLNMIAPGMTVTGGGTVTEPGEMNLKMLSTLTNQSAIGGVLSKISGGNGTLPFTLKGTFEHPVIVPDVGKMATQQLGQPKDAVGKILGGIFGKKNN